jgi:hypothetical protein
MDEHVPDNDWISRRWQGEGQVVRKDPVRAGEAPVKAQREAGDTQFEGGLGAHCAQCGRLDFLPLACQFCAQPFCADCIDVDVHACGRKHAHQPRRVPDMSGFAKPGDHVLLDGLVKAAAHNGKEAVVQRASLQRGSSGHDRFVIRTASGTELAVKPKNMRHVPSPPAQQARGAPVVQEQAPPSTASYRTQGGVVVSSLLEFLVESKLSRYREQLITTAGLQLSDAKAITDADLLSAGVEKEFHRLRFLREARQLLPVRAEVENSTRTVVPPAAIEAEATAMLSALKQQADRDVAEAAVASVIQEAPTRAVPQPEQEPEPEPEPAPAPKPQLQLEPSAEEGTPPSDTASTAAATAAAAPGLLQRTGSSARVELLRTRSQQERVGAVAAAEALAAEAASEAEVEAELRATKSVLQCAEIDRAIEQVRLSAFQRCPIFFQLG